MSDMKTVVHRRGILHVETPLGIVNIHVGLGDARGRRVETVMMDPNRYAGEKKVYLRTNRFVESLRAKN